MLRSPWKHTVADILGRNQTYRSPWGVEIEVEGAFLPQPPEGWCSHHENSLRGEANEYVCSRPYSRPALEKKLQTLAAAFEDQRRQGLGVVHLDSPRTSVHIHRNVYGCTGIDTLGVYILFTALEPLILRLCGQQRDGNLFCLPSYDCGDHAETLQHSLAVGMLTGRGKYAALNSNSIGERGSLEFRCFPCSITPEVILGWVDWIEGIFMTVEAQEDKTFMRLVESIADDPLGMARRILGQAVFNTGPTDAETLLQVGIQGAYELAGMLHDNRRVIYENVR